MIDFKLNRKIEVYAENELKMGASTVKDAGEESIFISYPMGPKGHVALTPGDIIKITYCGDENKFYEFMAEVDSIVTDDLTPLIKINKPSDYEVVQKREYVRIPIVLDVEFAIMHEKTKIDNMKSNELKKSYKSKRWMKGYACDISAGGIGVVMQEPVEYGKKIICIILDEYFDRGYTGRVVRVTEKMQGGKKLYTVGVQFLGLDYQAEEKLVKYIFQKMRKQLKVR